MKIVSLTDEKWLLRGLSLAREAATWSKDPKCQVGACVAPSSFRQFSLGFNGFPQGIADTPDRLHDKVIKNALMRHAEANALSNAPFSTQDCYMFVTRQPCTRCVIDHIIPAGIKAVVIDKKFQEYDKASSRHKNLMEALQYLKEANIEVLII